MACGSCHKHPSLCVGHVTNIQAGVWVMSQTSKLVCGSCHKHPSWCVGHVTNIQACVWIMSQTSKLVCRSCHKHPSWCVGHVTNIEAGVWVMSQASKLVCGSCHKHLTWCADFESSSGQNNAQFLLVLRLLEAGLTQPITKRSPAYPGSKCEMLCASRLPPSFAFFDVSLDTRLNHHLYSKFRIQSSALAVLAVRQQNICCSPGIVSTAISTASLV